MSSRARISMISLVVSAVLVLLATTVLPVRVRMSPRSFTCVTVIDRLPQPDALGAAFCERVGAYRFRATAGIGALLAALSLLPLVLRRRSELLAWAGVSVTVALGAFALPAAVGGRWEKVYDLSWASAAP